MNQSEVSRHLARLDLDAKVDDLDTIRLAYIQHLREVAAGHSDEDGDSLVRERIETERVERQLKILTLEEKRGNLVDVAKLEPELVQMFAAFKIELLAMSDKIQDDIKVLYGIDLDGEIITGQVESALSHLSRYDPEHKAASH